MKDLHIIPYGYRRVNGNIVVHPEEAQTVKLIFREYIGGLSFRKLARLLQEKGYVYVNESGKWSMGALKKLVDRECYIGNDGYPRIISDDDFQKVKELESSRRKNHLKATEDNLLLRRIVMCGECGERLTRFESQYKGIQTFYWRCTNSDCSHLGFGVTDETLATAFDRAIASADRENDISVISYEPNSKVIYQQNQINQMFDSDKADYDRIKEEIVRLASMKYDCIDYKCSNIQAEIIAELLAEYEPEIEKRAEFIRECVSKIIINNEHEFIAELIDGTSLKTYIERTRKNE